MHALVDELCKEEDDQAPPPGKAGGFLEMIWRGPSFGKKIIFHPYAVEGEENGIASSSGSI